METLRQNYLERLNSLHQFLYCELPLKMMAGIDESSQDLQDRLYNLVETGYIRQNEIRIQKLISENNQLRQGKENNKLDSNILKVDELNVNMQKLIIENRQLTANFNKQQEHIQKLTKTAQEDNHQIEIKDGLIEELNSNLQRAEVALTDLTEEYIQYKNTSEEERNTLNGQIEELQQIINDNQMNNSEIFDRLNALATETQSLQKLEDQNTSLKRLLMDVKTKFQRGLNDLRTELIQLKAELKIKCQIVEQNKSGIISDMIKGIHQIISKHRSEAQNTILVCKNQMSVQLEEQQNQILKMKRDIQFYKALEEEYEVKVTDALEETNKFKSLASEKEQQLLTIQSKLDLIQQNIISTEQLHETALRDQQNELQKQFKLQFANLQQQLYLLQQEQNETNKSFETKIIQLQKSKSKESEELIQGLTKELEQSIETIKRQHNQIKNLELEQLHKIIPPMDQLKLERPKSRGFEEQREQLNKLKQLNQQTLKRYHQK